MTFDFSDKKRIKFLFYYDTVNIKPTKYFISDFCLSIHPEAINIIVIWIDVDTPLVVSAQSIVNNVFLPKFQTIVKYFTPRKP